MLIGRNKGFTLVEMIVTIVITAFLGIVVYTTFSQGVRLWTRTAKDHGEWKVDLWVEKITADLRNVFQDPQWPMKGTRTELAFATLLHEAHGNISGTPSYFRYFFDSNAQSVVCQRYAFENVLMSKPSPQVTMPALEKIVSFDLEYYTYDPKAKAYHWRSQWNKDCFPETVKITIEPEQMNHRKWIRMIPIPTERVCPE